MGTLAEGRASSNRKDRGLQATTEPRPKAPKLLLVQMAWADVTNVLVDVLVDDEDVLADWALVGRDVEPGRDDGTP